MFEESPGMFTNVRYWNLDYGIDAGLFAVPRLIDGAVSPKNSMTLLSWYRQNFMEYFMPSSLNMSELQSRFSLIRRQLDAKPEMVNFGNGDNLDTLVNELLPLRSMYSKETFFTFVVGTVARREQSTRVVLLAKRCRFAQVRSTEHRSALSLLFWWRQTASMRPRNYKTPVDVLLTFLKTL